MGASSFQSEESAVESRIKLVSITPIVSKLQTEWIALSKKIAVSNCREGKEK